MKENVALPRMSKPSLVLLFCLLSLGVGEYYGLDTLFWVGFVMTVLVSLLVLIVLVAYTVDYCREHLCCKNTH